MVELVATNSGPDTPLVQLEYLNLAAGCHTTLRFISTIVRNEDGNKNTDNLKYKDYLKDQENHKNEDLKSRNLGPRFPIFRMSEHTIDLLRQD